jgi:hypothetical protein
MTIQSTICQTAIALVLAVSSSAAQAQPLSREAAQDLARVFGPSPREAARFGNAMKLESLRASTQAGVTSHPTCILPNVANAKAAATTPRDVFTEWHCLSLNLLAVDHIPELDDQGNELHYQQFGPHRASYAAAMTTWRCMKSQMRSPPRPTSTKVGSANNCRA